MPPAGPHRLTCLPGQAPGAVAAVQKCGCLRQGPRSPAGGRVQRGRQCQGSARLQKPGLRDAGLGAHHKRGEVPTEKPLVPPVGEGAGQQVGHGVPATASHAQPRAARRPGDRFDFASPGFFFFKLCCSLAPMLLCGRPRRGGRGKPGPEPVLCNA